MSEQRKYELRKRAERLADTRRRITEATVELHRTVGPAATQINEVARRADGTVQLAGGFGDPPPGVGQPFGPLPL